MANIPALVALKLETGYGVDAAPGVNDVIIAFNPGIKVKEKRLEDESVKPFLGGSPGLNIGEGFELDFETYLKNGGAAGTVGAMDPAWRAVYMSQTINAGTDVQYLPHDNKLTGESLTIYFYYYDGLLHKMTGARGTWDITIASNEYAKAKYSFHGKYGGIVSGTFPAPNYEASDPIRVRNIGFQLDGDATYVVDKIEFSGGISIQKRDDVNATDGVNMFYMDDRKTTCKMSPEITKDKNFNTAWLGNNTHTLTLTIGSVGGNKVKIDCPKMQLTAWPGYGDKNGLVTQDCQFACLPDVGNDEIKFTKL